MEMKLKEGGGREGRGGIKRKKSEGGGRERRGQRREGREREKGYLGM